MVYAVYINNAMRRTMQEITLLSFPKSPNTRSVKVPGIKAIRCFTGLGLKEAKELIERLEEGVSEKLPLRKGDNEAAALKEFHRLGGVYTTGDRMVDLLEEALKIAVQRKQYGLSKHISAALELLY